MRKQELVTEGDIINGLKANDSRILGYLFDFYYTPLVQFAEKLTGDRAEAEDIYLNILHKFWRMRENFESSANIKAFLYISVRNNCLDFLRSRQRERNREANLKTHLQNTESTDNIERAIIKSEFMQLVYLRVQNLPERCRDVFIMTYFEGLKADEIARKLNITVSNVTSQRARAIKYLRSSFGDDKYLLACLSFICFSGPELLN